MINIQDYLLKDIEKYCKINNIENIEEEINKLLRIGLNVAKFGKSPFERVKMEKGLTTSPTEEKPHIEAKISEKEKPIETKEKTPIEEELKPKHTYTKRKVRVIKNE